MSYLNLWRALGLPERSKPQPQSPEPWGHYFPIGLHELKPNYVEHPSLLYGYYESVCEVRCVGSDVHEALDAYLRWLRRQG